MDLSVNLRRCHLFVCVWKRVGENTRYIHDLFAFSPNGLHIFYVVINQQEIERNHFKNVSYGIYVISSLIVPNHVIWTIFPIKKNIVISCLNNYGLLLYMKGPYDGERV